MDFDALRLEDLQQRHGIKWTRYGEGVLPLWVADMDLPVAEPIRRAIEGLAERSDFGYPYPPNYGPLREVFVRRMHERFDWQVDPERVEVILNVLQGIDAVLRTQTVPGDGVVVQTPIYPPFLQVVSTNDRRVVDNPLRRGEHRFEIDLAQLRDAVDKTTRILLLCNPHNPTGRVFERRELEGLAEIVIDHDLLAISDEIHADLVHSGARHVPFATLGAEIAARTVTLTSATKSFNVAGLPCAVMVFGTGELQERFRELSSFLLAHPGIAGIEAALAAWQEGDAWLAEVLHYLDGNRDLLGRFLAEHLPEIDYVAPEATYLAWLDCRPLGLGAGPSRFFLKQAKVALHDGRDFGAAGQGGARINFATSRAILEQALARMADAVRQRRD